MKIDFTFDSTNYRHYMDGINSVLHCHHYITLTQKTAHKYAAMGGNKILTESAEDAFRPLFDAGIQKNNLADPASRLAACTEYYSAMGMGLVNMKGDASGGEATLQRSHVDQGWLKKFGPSQLPVNYVTCGFLAAAFAAAHGKPARSYQVTETASIAKGDPESKFSVVCK